MNEKRFFATPHSPFSRFFIGCLRPENRFLRSPCKCLISCTLCSDTYVEQGKYLNLTLREILD